MYADVGRGRNRTNTPEAWAERAKEGVADGFQSIKFDIDGSANELWHDPVDRGQLKEMIYATTARKMEFWRDFTYLLVQCSLRRLL